MTACLFVVSAGFPVLASVLEGPVPRWVGFVDVALALAVVAAAARIAVRAPSARGGQAIETSFRLYRGGATLFLVLLAVFLLAGDGVKWSILLPGLAWRAWLAVWVLPPALTLWRESAQ